MRPHDPLAIAYARQQVRERANVVRERVSVSDVVGRVVALKRSGADWFGVCPFHNEKTPSFTVNDKKGFFHCFGCGAHGDALAFVMQRQGLEFGAALELLESENGLRHLQASRPPPPTKIEQREDLDKLARIRRTWAETREDLAVDSYLRGRHCVPPSSYGCGDPALNNGWPADLRFHPAMWHGVEKRELPAMVAAYRKPDGALVALHRTFLRRRGDGVWVKAGTASDKMHWGSRKGAWIHLAPPADLMCGGEGIETSLSAGALWKRAPMCFGSADAMAEVEPPFVCSDFVYAADWNARTRTGEKAAWAGKKKFGVPMGRSCIVKVPNLRHLEKADFNDVARERAEAAPNAVQVVA